MASMATPIAIAMTTAHAQPQLVDAVGQRAGGAADAPPVSRSRGGAVPGRVVAEHPQLFGGRLRCRAPGGRPGHGAR